MSQFDQLTNYAKDRVQATQVPASLYSRAALRKNVLDTMVTVIVASMIVYLSTMQSSRKVSMTPPAVNDYVKHEMTTVEVRQ